MIYTVFCTIADDAAQWRSELLEYSWGRVRQPGELVRLTAVAPGEPLPRQRLARVVATSCWSPHPYTGDSYPPYNTAAALLEWLFTERIDGTILLVRPDSVFRASVETEVGPGQARATAWPALPDNGSGVSGSEHFGLGPNLAFLENFCVDCRLALPPVTLPVLIHASDLRRMAARWLELMSIIRAEMAAGVDGKSDRVADMAYAIAAAEARIAHAVTDLGVDTGAGPSQAVLIHYGQPIESADGDSVWNQHLYQPWTSVDPGRASSGSGHEVLALLEEYCARRAAGGDHAMLRPRRRPGVRVGRVLDRTLLEIPGRSDTLSLNPSAAAIWELCDGKLDLADLQGRLENRFQLAPGALGGSLQSVIDQLHNVGALDLEPA